MLASRCAACTARGGGAGRAGLGRGRRARAAAGVRTVVRAGRARGSAQRQGVGARGREGAGGLAVGGGRRVGVEGMRAGPRSHTCARMGEGVRAGRGRARRGCCAGCEGLDGARGGVGWVVAGTQAPTGEGGWAWHERGRGGRGCGAGVREEAILADGVGGWERRGWDCLGWGSWGPRWGGQWPGWPHVGSRGRVEFDMTERDPGHRRRSRGEWIGGDREAGAAQNTPWPAPWPAPRSAPWSI